ncbi:nucleoside diphosphate kinase A-like isoform X1 [Carcharodon carcharias]|uniref:nucleoside diphosphate kinase A-like isoform X1 n=1 Tax=Carcharodon carcharias TaxID=13397 RepID=UPI001B7DCE03|nr:nucleoside diphosphate kinase A-like isoform X1 [Carcharodon carcharias]
MRARGVMLLRGLSRCLTVGIIRGFTPPPETPRLSWAAARLRFHSAGVFGIREQTLVAVKPDGVQRRLVGEIIQRFEKRGFQLVGLKLVQPTQDVLSEHYHDLHEKPFYSALIQYMSSGPVVVMVWEGCDVVRVSRMMVGDTNPADARPGTVRGDWCVHISRNAIHASDSVEVAKKEISLWFHSSELVEWESCTHKNTYNI